MAGMVLKSLVYVGLVMGLVAGCEPGTSGQAVTSAPLADGAAAPGASVAPATSVRLVDHDVEAPQDFQVTDKALWDGRPSLGGVWVAATSVSDPMRVIMRNPSNGKFVIGALFRREADNPGPKLQISSDAADALGLVAGEPATLNVTALRREEAPVPVPDATRPLLDTSETLAGADVAAATDAAITAAPMQPATADDADPEPSNLQPTTAADPAPRKSLFGKLFAAKPATEPAPLTGTQPVTPAAQPAPQVDPVLTAPRGAQIQIGIFSVEANANRAVATLAKAGIAASVRKETSHGKPLWSVVATGNAALLAQIKQAGFKDAYVIKR